MKLTFICELAGEPKPSVRCISTLKPEDYLWTFALITKIMRSVWFALARYQRQSASKGNTHSVDIFSMNECKYRLAE